MAQRDPLMRKYTVYYGQIAVNAARTHHTVTITATGVLRLSKSQDGD